MLKSLHAAGSERGWGAAVQQIHSASRGFKATRALSIHELGRGATYVR